MEGRENSFINGLMFLMINDTLYPRSVRTTTFNCELTELLDDRSPMVNPVIDKALYRLGDDELFVTLADRTYPVDADIDNDYSYLLPFHEINDEGWSIFIISDGESVRLFVGETAGNGQKLRDTIEIPLKKYNSTIDRLKEFYKEIINEWRS